MTLHYPFSRTAIAVFVLMLFLLPATILCAADTELCSGLTIEEAAEMLGVPEADIRASENKMPVSPDDSANNVYTTPPSSCTFSSQADFLKSVSYVVYVFSSDTQAMKDFNTMKANFETVAQTQAVGLGDRAFRVDDKRFQRTVGLEKNVLVDVLSPKTAELQQQILQQVLKEY